MRPVVYTRKIRYSDTDAQGIVFNANYLRYLDDAVTDLFDEMGFGGGRLAELGYETVVAKATIDFRSAARLGDVVETAVHIAERGRTSYTVIGRMTDRSNGRVIAEAHEIHVVVDVTTFQPTPIPDFFIEAITHVQGDTPATRPVGSSAE